MRNLELCFNRVKKNFEIHENITASLFFATLILIFFFPVVFQGKTLTTSVNWGSVMNNGPYGYDGVRPSMLAVRDPGAFGWQDAPLTNYIGKIIKNEHRIPLWNPNMGLGYPILAGIQEGIFFPLNFINFLFSSELSWDIFFLIRIFLAGFFTYLFARKIGLEKIAAYVSAIIFMFNGYTLEYLNMAHLSTEALIPLILLCTEYFLEKRNIKSFILYTVALALAILPGMPEATFFVFLISFLWFAFSLFFLHPEINKREKYWLIFFLALSNTLSLLLTAVQLIPFLELLKNSFNTHSYGTPGLYFIPLNFSFSLFSPFISNPLFNWIGGAVSYLGISSFALSVLAILSFRTFTAKKGRILLFFSLFALLLLAKIYGLFFINLIGNLPILKTLIFPKYAIPTVMFSFSILAGFGLSSLNEKKIKWLNLKIFSSLIIIITSFFYMLCRNANLFAQNTKSINSTLSIFYLNFQKIFPFKIPGLFLESNRPSFDPTYLFLILLITITILSTLWLLTLVFFHKKSTLSWLITVFVFLELYAYALPLQRADRYDTYKKAPYLDFLEEKTKTDGEIFRVYAQSAKKVQPSVLYPNISSVFGLQDIRFLLALGEKRYFEFLEKIVGVPTEEVSTIRFTGDYPTSLDNKYFDLLNVKYFIIPSEFEISDNVGEIVYNKEVKIIKNKNYLPRVFIVQKAVESSKSDVFAKLKKNDFDFKKEIVIENDTKNKLTESPTDTSSTDSIATITNYDDERVDIETQTNKHGYLVLSDQYYPGWKAFIDGKETEIFPTDYVFRSIKITKGTHAVSFIYDPLSYQAGKWISLASLFFLIILFLFEKTIPFKKKKNLQ